MRTKATFAVVLGIVMVFIGSGVSLTAFEAAQESEGQTIEALSSESVYLGPMQTNQMMDQRAQRHAREQAAATIDVYNVWTSDVKIKKNNSTQSLKGHNYVICADYDPSIYHGHVVYSYGSSIKVQVKYTWSKAASMTATTQHSLSGEGWHLITDSFRTSDFRKKDYNYYKVKAKYTVIQGGSGGGQETAFFDIVPCH